MGAEELRAALRSTDEVDLIVTGRASGRESSRPVWFVEEGEALYLLPVTGSDSNWYKNIVKSPAVRLAADGTELSTNARPIDAAAEVDDVVERFRGKYGAEQIRAYYSKLDVAVEVPL